MDRPIDSYRVDRSAYCVASLEDESDERAFWQTQSPAARMEALEFLRQVMYGVDRATARLQRVLTVAQREPS
ncbi:MAG: hypothetical protein A2V70_17640 [Planctomycetes bacterium RBG_13_63_9]|nr:MAG: hypothetical protein A2V70_17640 [Planctomycetes bacterium RBG_13_63_9]